MCGGLMKGCQWKFCKTEKTNIKNSMLLHKLSKFQYKTNAIAKSINATYKLHTSMESSEHEDEENCAQKFCKILARHPF